MTRSFLISFVCCIFSFTLLYQADSGPNDPVSIPDTALRAEIETMLGKSPGNTITESEMNGMTGQFSAQNKGISNLTGLEHATGIDNFLLSDNSITDLSPLAELTQLTRLNIGYNPITNISPLAKLTSLVDLEIGGNGRTGSPAITDISPLAELTQLTRLILNRNRIADISTLTSLTALTTLDLTRNLIVDISHLANLTALTHLWLGSNRISNIAALRNLTALTYLTLSGNWNLSDISVLENLTNLEVLWLGWTRITSSGLKAVLPFFSSLKRLMITTTTIPDLSVLENLAGSVSLEILNVPFMAKLPIASLEEAGWLVTDISPLVRLLNAGVLGAHTRNIDMRGNWLLDYDSFYEYIPDLLDGGVRSIEYSAVTPALRSISAENHLGRPGTPHTFVVGAVSTSEDFRHIYWSSETYTQYKVNNEFTGVPITWRVTNPDGIVLETEEDSGDDGLARFAITLGDHGDVYTAEAIVPAKQNTNGPSHGELRVTFTATADRDAPPPSGSSAPTVTFEDYPEDRPTEEFTLTLKFSERVSGFQKEDITVETQLRRGTGTATLEALTPIEGPAQTYIARIGVPARATGTVTVIVHSGAATSSLSGIRGPVTDTPSEPIPFGRRGPLLFPSHVAMDTLIFNEFRNATDDTNDWLELKNISDEPVSLKDWEVSLVVPHAVSPATPLTDIYAMDKDIVAFGDWTLPPGEILLIMNTDPSENDLLRGQNIEQPGHPSKRRPFYLRAPEMQIPTGPYLLILRSARDKNGIPAAFEDLLGEYHKGDVNYRTHIWPLRDTPVYLGTAVDLSEGEVYQRRMVPRVTGLHLKPRLQPEKRGYLRGAWALSEVQSGLGYRPGAPIETSLGTPGYPNVGNVLETGRGTLSISEVMFATNEKGSPSQWIELYNPSSTEIVNLEGWQLRIEVRDSQPVHRHTTFGFKSLAVMPNQTVLLVMRQDRSSRNIPMSQIYELQPRNRHALVLRSEGFAVRLLSRDGTLVDIAGNLDGRMGRDTPRWQLPSGWMEDGSRTSLIRRYEAGVALRGTVSEGWVRAGETALIGAWTYYGLAGDHGTPGYRQGSPLPVELSSLRADLKEGAVIVKWTTASEMENAGFHVLRSQESGSGFVQVNPALIPGAGTTAEGQTYRCRDTTARVNVPYYYRLEEVSLSGERRAVATVRLRGHVSAANKVLWKWADVKSTD